MTAPRSIEVVDLTKRVSFCLGEDIQCETRPDRLDLSVHAERGTGPSLKDDSGHLSEASYDLAWDRDRGWARRRMTGISDSDHSLPMDELNTPIRDDLSDSMLEEIAGIEDFAQCSFEIDELNLSNEFLEFMPPPESPLRELKHIPFHNGKGDNELSVRRRRKSPVDIKTLRADKLDGSCTGCDISNSKDKLTTDAQIQAIGEIIQSMKMNNDNADNGHLENSRHAN